MIKNILVFLTVFTTHLCSADEIKWWAVNGTNDSCFLVKFPTPEAAGTCAAKSLDRPQTTTGPACSGSFVSLVAQPGGHFYANVIRNCSSFTHETYGLLPAKQDNWQFDVTWGIYSYFAAAIDDKPPPKTCSGNPVETGTGLKIQREDDLIPKGIGQVELTRYYNSGTWRHSYQRYVRKFTDTDIQIKSPIYVGKKEACQSGWTNIKNSISANWAVGSYAILNGDTCSVIKNGVVVRNLLVKDGFDEPQPVMDGIRIVREDGSVTTIQNSDNSTFKSLTGEAGRLERINNGTVMWRYHTAAEVEDYSDAGKLLNITNTNGMKQTLTYDAVSGLLTKVQDSVGGSLQFFYTGTQLTSVTTNNNKTTSFIYNSTGVITEVKRVDNNTRKYHYEDTRFPKFLTGITDERDVRYATWAYDDKGRAISSEHAGGAEKTTLAFNADGSTTVTNALNKQTIYRFADIAGVRRVASVEGQPTANCVGANQNYTYTAEGWVESKTDWKGNKTFYTYNSKGQEISRTEAYGTSLAKTITAEWHSTLNVKTKVTEPGKEITYIYDTDGLLINQKVQSLP